MFSAVRYLPFYGKDRRQGSLRMPESRNSNSTLSERHAVGRMLLERNTI